MVVDGGATVNIPPPDSYTSEDVGSSSAGTIDQSSAVNSTNTVALTLTLGTTSTGSGTYILSGGALSVLFEEIIGNSGSGAFTQSGGTNTVTGTLYVGHDATSTGTYTLSGTGTLSAANEYIGFSGNGAFTQSGGTHTMTGDLYLGYNSRGTGTYNLIAGSLSVGGDEVIGESGSGTFTQSGGTHMVSGGLYLGDSPGASGTYNLNGGSLSVSGGEYIGVGSSGNFIQTGGSNTVSGGITLGSGSSGTYTLSGGSLAADSISGNLINGGAFTPANSFSPIPITGNYTQTASGTLVEQIASASSYSKLAVTGSASLNGALNIQLLGGYIPTAGQGFSGILTAAGGVSGGFTSIINRYITPTLYWQVLYGANSVDLQTGTGATVARNYTSPSLNLTHNQWAVGNMLNGVANSATGDLNTVLNAIDSLPSNGAVANAYQQISPEKAAALSTLAFAGANLQKSTLSRRITDLRFGPEDASLAARGPGSFNLNYGQGEGVMVASTATSLTGLLSGQKDPGTLERPWGVYFDPGLILGGQGSTVDQTGFGFTMAGFTAGADYRLWQDLLLGLNTGYTYTSAGFHGSGGSVQGNTWPLNAYAAYLPKPFYAYGSLGYALNLFNLQRDINFGGLDRAASSSSTGNQLNGYAETGYDLKLNPVVLTPGGEPVLLETLAERLHGNRRRGAGPDGGPPERPIAANRGGRQDRPAPQAGPGDGDPPGVRLLSA